jgi:predicted nucleotidyltransferase
MNETGEIIAVLRAALPGLRVDLVSAAALKPYIGGRVRAEALTL